MEGKKRETETDGEYEGWKETEGEKEVSEGVPQRVYAKL